MRIKARSGKRIERACNKVSGGGIAVGGKRLVDGFCLVRVVEFGSLREAKGMEEEVSAGS